MTFAASKFRAFLPAATFSMLAEFLMGLSDSVIAGHVIGENGLSAVNLMQPAMNVVSFFAMLVGTGTSVLYATEMGRFERRRASEMLTQGLWSTLAFGVFLMAAFVLLRGPALASFGVSGEVLSGVGEYWTWFLPCALLEPLAFFFSCMCYADGDSRICTFAYVAQLFGNCLMSVPLTMCFGLAGCATGTGLGHLLAIVVLLLHFRRKGNSLAFVRHFSLRDSWRICWCAAGDASIRLCYAILFFALNCYAVARFGAERLPVVAVVVAMLGLSEAFDGVPRAAQPLAGVYIGERNDRLVARILGYASRAALLEGLAATALLVAFPGAAVSLVGISDPSLVPAARSAVRIVALGFVGTAFVGLFNSFYTFIGREGLAVCLTVLAALVAPGALFPVSGALWGETGVWSALAATPYVALALVAAYVLFKEGPARFPLFLERSRQRRQRVFDLVLEETAICRVAAYIERYLKVRRELDARRASLSALLVEEALMAIRDRNAGRTISAEITIDRNDGLMIVIRDDGEIFDITDADASISSLRSYLVSNLMAVIPARRNMTTTGFNRNAFRL